MKKKSFNSKNLLAALIVSALLLIPFGAPKEPQTIELQSSKSTSSPRYRLAKSAEKVNPNRQTLLASDFNWEALAKDSPATGRNPSIGDRNVGGYYDFADGLPEPVFIPLQDSKKTSALQ